MKLLSDLDVSQKRVFLRADLDVDVVELKGEGVRLRSLRSSVDWLLENGARQVIIAGHIGRPKGSDPALSTKKLIEPLQKILGKEIEFKKDLDSIASLQNDKRVILLENLRFWPGEEANDPEFAKKLAGLADVYVDDAFAVCHRAHASIVGIPALLPHAAGLHLEEEVNQLTKLIENPHRPFVAIVGGAKIETKIPVITNLAKIADSVLVGGYLPIEIKKEGLRVPNNVTIALLTDDLKDIDQLSISSFCQTISRASTVVWNGNLGLTEEGFEVGTVEIANAIVNSAAYCVVGGGDTTEFLGTKSFLDKFSFVSSGGGAMLEFLSGKQLPGIAALG